MPIAGLPFALRCGRSICASSLGRLAQAAAQPEEPVPRRQIHISLVTKESLGRDFWRAVWSLRDAHRAFGLTGPEVLASHHADPLHQLPTAIRRCVESSEPPSLLGSSHRQDARPPKCGSSIHHRNAAPLEWSASPKMLADLCAPARAPTIDVKSRLSSFLERPKARCESIGLSDPAGRRAPRYYVYNTPTNFGCRPWGELAARLAPENTPPRIANLLSHQKPKSVSCEAFKWASLMIT